MSVSRHTTYNLVGSILPIILALATVPIYLRLVGPDRYGVLAIAWLLLGYFGLFDLGLGRATSFRIAALRDASPTARADTFWAALSVNLGMGVLGGAALWAAGSYFFTHIFKVDEGLRPEILYSVPLLAAGVPIATLTGVLTGAMQGRQKFLETNAISVVSTGLFQLFPLAVAWWVGPNLVWLLTAAVMARVLALVGLGYLCHVELTRGHPGRLVRDEIPLLLKYGGWVTLSSMFGPLLVIIDRFVIGAMFGAVAVTVYTVPFQLAQRIQILPVAVTNALFPRMSAASADERHAMSHSASLALASLVSLPVLGLIYILDPFLVLWVGAKIAAEAAPIGRILIIGFWANAFALIPFMRMQSKGRPDLVTKVLLIQVAPYLIGLYFGMKWYGLPGAAFAFTGRCVVDYVMLNWVAGRDFRTLPVLALNFALLISATVISQIWSLSRWEWWASAAAIGVAMLALAWRSLPADASEQILHRIIFLRTRRSKQP